MNVIVLLLLLVLNYGNSKYVLNLSSKKSIVLAMIVRDNEPLLSTTLSNWLKITKHFVFVIDSSSSSSSSSYNIIQSFIKNNTNDKIYTIIDTKPFESYDKFRNIALKLSTSSYPEVSHIWLGINHYFKTYIYQYNIIT